jgi:hypothetical protein
VHECDCYLTGRKLFFSVVLVKLVLIISLLVIRPKQSKMARPSYMSSEPNSISKHHEVAIAIPDDTVLEEPVDNWSAKERSNLYSDLYNCKSMQMGAAEKNINTSNPSSNVVTLVMPHTTHGRKPPVPIILKVVL